MAKKKANSDIPPNNPAEFAQAVIALYRDAIRAQEGASTRKFEGNVSRGVRQVAFALAFIRDLLDQDLKYRRKSADMMITGSRDAYGILDHLITGRDHPISKHIQGIHSGTFRPQCAKINAADRLAQMCVVGVVRKYQTAAQVKQSEAIKVITTRCQDTDFAFTGDQIRGWDKKFRRDADPGPSAFAKTLLDHCGSDAAKVLDLGMTWIYKFWVVPWPPMHD